MINLHSTSPHHPLQTQTSKPIFSLHLHFTLTIPTNCSTKCLAHRRRHHHHHHKPTSQSLSNFRLHPPPFLLQTLPLLRLPNRRSRLIFNPNQRYQQRPMNLQIHPPPLQRNQGHKLTIQPQPTSQNSLFRRGDCLLGVQAFQDELLKACGRAHGVDEVHEAIGVVGTCGVENWSMDLISSLPHQTPQMWEESLLLTVNARPKHVSVYDLQVERGTKFGILYSPGEFPLPSETQSAEFYKTASRVLSDAAQPNLLGQQSFYGFGLGSTSFLGGFRFSRPKKMKEYAGYDQNLEDRVVGLSEDSFPDPKDMAMDAVMLSFRTAKGLDLKSFRKTFGTSLVHYLCKAYRPFVKSGHVVCLDRHRTLITTDRFCALLSDEEEIEETVAFIRLSDPDGFLLSNELVSLAFQVIAP
ncbi:unnamed protein product [Camellia sinensis]